MSHVQVAASPKTLAKTTCLATHLPALGPPIVGRYECLRGPAASDAAAEAAALERGGRVPRVRARGRGGRGRGRGRRRLACLALLLRAVERRHRRVPRPHRVLPLRACRGGALCRRADRGYEPRILARQRVDLRRVVRVVAHGGGERDLALVRARVQRPDQGRGCLADEHEHGKLHLSLCVQREPLPPDAPTHREERELDAHAPELVVAAAAAAVVVHRHHLELVLPLRDEEERALRVGWVQRLGAHWGRGGRGEGGI